MSPSLFSTLIEHAQAACIGGGACLTVPGTNLSIVQIADRVITFMAGSIVAVGTAMFIVGAFMLVLSGAKEEYKDKAKNLMIGSIVSIAVVLGAYAILRTVDYFLS